MKSTAVKGKYQPKNKQKFLGKRAPVYRSMWERRFMIYCDKSESIFEWDSESIHIPYISIIAVIVLSYLSLYLI